jgi:hypothetical protein
MLTIDVQTDVTLSWLSDLGERQLPFATSKALNAVAKDVQTAERAHLRDIFHLNRDQWADRSMKITHFASKTELWAEIAVAPPGQTDKSDVLGKFEDETSKAPSQGGKSIVIPTADVARTGGGVIAKSQRPKAFHFQAAQGQHGGLTVLVGDNHTVLLQHPDGRGLIVQHDGHHTPGARDGTVLYFLKPSVTIHPDLHFERIGEAVVDARWDARFDEAWQLALETAR